MTALEYCLATSAVLLKRLICVLTDVPVAVTFMLDWNMVLTVTVQILFAPTLSRLPKVNARHHAPATVSFFFFIISVFN
jgi:hypothetical protein